jgi:DNA-directed RNA polymerase subunit H (RpoH/RPB5)
MKSYQDEMNFGFLVIRDLTKEILDKSAVTKLHLPKWKTRSPIVFIINLKEYSSF